MLKCRTKYPLCSPATNRIIVPENGECYLKYLEDGFVIVTTEDDSYEWAAEYPDIKVKMLDKWVELNKDLVEFLANFKNLKE